ncbi:hypothetical protein GWI33_021046 [Rhynchophorus ferrugineus]|uniref:Uncharacterized protein n=1 Tax=Rhynchophorus ferrugineus TaxID=354439 RepID=A0A834HTD6_RHYFE|nr:hypothetical protein GWI33_021046 [Rhynchophorus ferrugineus]
MASKFVVAALLVMTITAQAQAACFLPPPQVPCYYPGSIPAIGRPGAGSGGVPVIIGGPGSVSPYPSSGAGSGAGASGSTGITLTAPSAPSVSFAHGPSLSLPSATVSFPSAAVPSYPTPTSIPCPKAPAPQVHNHADVAIPLALPSAIPLGQYCSCQKYSIKPTIVPCH